MKQALIKQTTEALKTCKSRKPVKPKLALQPCPAPPGLQKKPTGKSIHPSVCNQQLHKKTQDVHKPRSANLGPMPLTNHPLAGFLFTKRLDVHAAFLKLLDGECPGDLHEVGLPFVWNA